MDYIQNTPDDVREMLQVIGAGSIDDLFRDIPGPIRLKRPLDLPAPLSEADVCGHIRMLGEKNRPLPPARTFLGGGMYNHYVPAAVEHIPSRGEYLTAYTPYQAEASQGTLQAVFEYQTMICDLTGLDVSNASHYDGATACAEAI
ncbi:MAG: glycine dehydrogenase, partial [Planctomycetota bacterium]